MAFHFFSEPAKLAPQTISQSFGVIDANQYRLGQMFSANASQVPKAFAVADGRVLVQKITGTNKYNIVLKPTEQPDLNLPKISYIIYKGIKEVSILNGANVASRTLNDLTRIVYENADKWNQEHSLPVPAVNIAASMALGLVYEAAAAAPYTKVDTDFIDDAFYAANDVTLPIISGGNYIGDFDEASDFGIVIIFEKIGYRPTFAMARELESKLTFTALASPTAAETFERKHKKEAVLSFIDPAAFFGSFYGSVLRVYNGTAFEDRTGDPLYTDVITKFLNPNKIYLDIRNEYEDSFNYYNNYHNNIAISLDNTNTLVPMNYYRSEWPLLVILDTEFSVPTGTEKIIRLSLPNPNHDNEFPLIYLRRAFRSELGTATLPQNNEKFLTPVSDDDVNTVNMIRLNRNLVFPRTGNTVFANYFQIKYIKRAKVDDDQNDNDQSHNPAGRALFKRTYLDNIFPIFDMQVPFEVTGRTNLKVYYDVAHIDKILVKDIAQTAITGNYVLRDYNSSIGIAKDANSVTFISFPFLYNNNINYNNDVLPLSGMEAGNNPFIIELNNRISSVNLVRSTFQDNGTDIEYLRFENNPAVADASFTPTNYTFRDVLLFSVTNQQYADMQLAATTEFPGGYKVYLGIKDITPILYNGNQYYSFHLVLRGLREINNDVRPHFYDTNIIAYTDEDILGLDSGHVFPVANAYIEEDYGERNGGHLGIDIETESDASTAGSPIYAARGGTVEKIVKLANLSHHGGGDSDKAGIRVRILGDNGYYYYYFHMQPNSNDALNLNDAVTAGQQIGTIGLSGQGHGVNPAWTQYHLHFEIWSSNNKNDKVNPYTVFPELALLPFDTDRGD